MKPEDIYSKSEIPAVGRVLTCALEEDPVLPHWEFPILTGISVDEALEIIRAWPKVDLSDDIARLTVHGILGHILGYPHKKWERVTQETGLSKEEVKFLYKKSKKAFP